MFRADGRRVIMKNDLRKAFELMKFGICVNKGINIGVLVLFVVIGLVGETFYLATGFTMNYGFDLFAFLLIAVLSFPAQFMVTTDVSHIVQTSSYKKKIQTKKMPEFRRKLNLNRPKKTLRKNRKTKLRRKQKMKKTKPKKILALTN